MYDGVFSLLLFRPNMFGVIIDTYTPFERLEINFCCNVWSYCRVHFRGQTSFEVARPEQRRTPHAPLTNHGAPPLLLTQASAHLLVSDPGKHDGSECRRERQKEGREIGLTQQSPHHLDDASLGGLVCRREQKEDEKQGGEE